MKVFITSVLTLFSTIGMANVSSVYDVDLPENKQLQVCKTSPDNSYLCGVYNTNDILVTVLTEKYATNATLTVCNDTVCNEYNGQFTAIVTDKPAFKPFAIPGDIGPEYTEQNDPELKPWIFKAVKGSGSSGFMGAMSKFGKAGMAKANELLSQADLGIKEAGGYIIMNDGTRVDAGYNFETDSWTVEVKGNGWGCKCGPGGTSEAP